MKSPNRWLWVLFVATFFLLSAEGFAGPAVALAQPASGEKDTVERILRTPPSGDVHLNPCFLPGVDIRQCLQTPTEGLSAERALKRSLTPFGDADARGNFLFSLSGRRAEWTVQNMSGEQAWILRWDLPEK
ncbi:MAG TPA: hypothetical protein VFG95_08695 [Nitrospiria bacterium]|nr:hypothetical protein [Nitrospiria bacterium]